MDRETILRIIQSAIDANVTPAGIVRMPVLSESSEQLAIDIVDALETAGLSIGPKSDASE